MLAAILNKMKTRFNASSRQHFPIAIVWLLLALLLAVAALVVYAGAFPALYGDEYGSLVESNHIFENLHAAGYFVQLKAWRVLSETDVWLRLLSVLWGAVTLAGCWLIGKEADLSTRTTWHWCALLAINGFFLQYALQIRFYAFFLACSILFIWRGLAWSRRRSVSNFVWLCLTAILLVSSHLFGWLVLFIGVSALLWPYLGRWRWPIALGVLALIACLALAQPMRSLGVSLVYRLTAHDTIPDAAIRGLSPAMLAKVPLTFFFFSLGERVYPLWWWITIPTVIIFAISALLGSQEVRRYPSVEPMVWLTLVSVVGMYFLLDPLAPPSLQGAAARYVIYALPFYLLVIVLGAMTRRWLLILVWLVSLGGLASLWLSPWSYGQGDLVNWPDLLKQAIPAPTQTCLVVDGRGRAPAERYAPAGVRLESDLDPCLDYERLVVITADYRLSQVRGFDGFAGRLAADYDLAASFSQFPAQLTAYQRRSSGLTRLPPGRLDLPEQDLRLPLHAANADLELAGFVRLDHVTPVYEGPLAVDAPAVVLSNFRSLTPVPPGTPVASITWLGAAGQQQETLLRAGQETAAWDGVCSSCLPAASWTKRLHLVGAQGYPGAYRHYQATVWAAPIDLPSWPIQSIRATSLLPEATVYLWGIYPSAQLTADN